MSPPFFHMSAKGTVCFRNVGVTNMQNAENGIRINKFLSEAGICSRREADREIDAGNVRI